MQVVVTAGHVDHGKSTLVRALTGMDPDRLAEEKTRGLTIDLGYAWTGLESPERASGLESPERASEPGARATPVEVAFVDVPGHARFVKNMLAGVGGIDACLFVVAATEGWMPQSEEHLRILELAGVRHGLVVLTKVGALDGEERGRVRAEVVRRAEGSFLAGVPVVEVDVPAQTGLEQLRGALLQVLGKVPPAPDLGRARLWIDRAFSVRGSGTVVTGTLAGGSMAVGDRLLLLAAAGTPEVEVRVRAMEMLQRAVSRAGPGSRVALNLALPARCRPTRGDALVAPGSWHRTRVFDATLEVLPGLDRRVGARGAYLAYAGSAETAVRITLLGRRASLAPGETGNVRLHIESSLPLVLGDRYVLRDSGRAATVGGGRVLDVAPVTRPSLARPSGSAAGILAERSFLSAEGLWRQTGERRRPDTPGGLVFDPKVLASAQAGLLERIDRAGELGLDLASLGPRDRDLVGSLTGVTTAYGRATRTGVSLAERLARHRYLAALKAAPFSPPPPDGIDRGELRALVQGGHVVERDRLCFAASAVVQAAALVASLLAESPHGVTVRAVRSALGTSRRCALALLAELDATGVTRRAGDVRVAGPRLPEPEVGTGAGPGRAGRATPGAAPPD